MLEERLRNHIKARKEFLQRAGMVGALSGDLIAVGAAGGGQMELELLEQVLDPPEEIALEELAEGDELGVQTQNTYYIICHSAEGRFTIMGNQKYCPEPTPAEIKGTNRGGQLIPGKVVVKGLLQFVPLDSGKTVTTTPIQSFILVRAKAAA